jgi:hypothetical protein
MLMLMVSLTLKMVVLKKLVQLLTTDVLGKILMVIQY